jgi:hypothetical protein
VPDAWVRLPLNNLFGRIRARVVTYDDLHVLVRLLTQRAKRAIEKLRTIVCRYRDCDLRCVVGAQAASEVE